MKSAQFIHIETYKQKQEKKTTKNNSDVRETHAWGVLSEAKREKGYCSHVENPAPPEVLYGVDISEIEKLTEDYILNFRMKNDAGVERKIRKDSAVLLSGVVSLDREDEDLWNDYKEEAITFLKRKYSDRLKSIIEHTDEAHPHLHFYVIAAHNELVNDLHDGKRATAEAVKFNRKNKNNKISQKEAYKNAMTKFQDDFYFSVSKKFNLSRTGERPRSRLSREQYKALEKERLDKIMLIDDLNNDAVKVKKDIEQNIKNSEIEIKNQKEKSKAEIALLERKTKKRASEKVILEFNNKNYFQKVLFSLDFKKKKISELEKENNNLKNNCKVINRRKNYYKKEVEKSEDFEVKYQNLRKDFNKRVDNVLVNIRSENEELKKENYSLKYRNKELKSKIDESINAVDFIERLRKKYGKNFDSFKKEIFTSEKKRKYKHS